MLSFFSISVHAQTKKDGTPDMRYNVNKGISTPSIRSSSPNVERNYPNGGQIRVQNGYMRKNGNYITPHIKTSPDNVRWNNNRRRN